MLALKSGAVPWREEHFVQSKGLVGKRVLDFLILPRLVPTAKPSSRYLGLTKRTPRACWPVLG